MSRQVIAAAALLSIAAGAHAQQRSVAVSTKGLDLSVAADARIFYGRLSRVASEGCGGAPTAFLASEEERYQACYKAAMDSAVAQTRAPLVAVMHGAKASQLAAR